MQEHMRNVGYVVNSAVVENRALRVRALGWNPLVLLRFGFPAVGRRNHDFVSCFLRIREGVLSSGQRSNLHL